MPSPFPITTTGLTTTVTTTQGAGETVPKWIDRHDTAVAAGTPSGNVLSTTYTSSSGSRTIQSTREEGESDDLFLARHRTEYLMEMIKDPPIP